MTAFLVSGIFGGCGRLHYTLRKILFVKYYSVYYTLVWGHSKMSPRKCQILDPLSPMSQLSTFFIIPPPSCHQTNSNKLLP